jgi:hypothetical protein
MTELIAKPCLFSATADAMTRSLTPPPTPLPPTVPWMVHVLLECCVYATFVTTVTLSEPKETGWGTWLKTGPNNATKSRTAAVSMMDCDAFEVGDGEAWEFGRR